MSSTLKYKGYFTHIQYSSEDKILWGKIEGIEDLVTFESEASDLIEQEFHTAVDDYLETCAQLGIEPKKSLSGNLNVRLGIELHRKIHIKACELNISINKFIVNALHAYIDQAKFVSIQNDFRGIIYSGDFSEISQEKVFIHNNSNFRPYGAH